MNISSTWIRGQGRERQIRVIGTFFCFTLVAIVEKLKIVAKDGNYFLSSEEIIFSH
jgi:hypothetical protein